MSLFKNIVKNTLLLFAVGVAVAFVAPVVAGLLGNTIMGQTGMEHALTSVAGSMWTGIVFGAFGGLHAALSPIADKIFGKDKGDKSTQPSKEQAVGRAIAAPGRTVIIARMQPETDRKDWLNFKREIFADGSLSIGYLTDKNGLNFSQEELKRLGVDTENPEKYDRNQPPLTLLKAVVEKLAVPEGQDIADAIIAHKTRENGWIDDRKNAGALKLLEVANSTGTGKGYMQLIEERRSVCEAPMVAK